MIHVGTLLTLMAMFVVNLDAWEPVFHDVDVGSVTLDRPPFQMSHRLDDFHTMIC